MSLSLVRHITQESGARRPNDKAQRVRSCGAGYRSWLLCLFLIWITLLSLSLPASAGPDKLWEQVSGDKALAHVQQLVDFGPRPPGSEAIEKSRIYIEKQLQAAGWTVARQAFSGDTPRGKV